MATRGAKRIKLLSVHHASWSVKPVGHTRGEANLARDILAKTEQETANTMGQQNWRTLAFDRMEHSGRKGPTNLRAAVVEALRNRPVRRHATMTTRRPSPLIAGVILVVLVAGLLPGCMIEQLLIGQWYSVHTPPAGACPRLEWRFVVDSNRTINGFLASEGQQRIANLSGLLNNDDSFQITATDVAGGRTASVTGQFTSQVSTISIHGVAAGRACDGQTFKLRLGSYFARQGGGGGGGG